MKTAYLMLLAFFLTAAAGCGTRYVDVRGEKFEMISEGEEKELAEHARLSLKTIQKRLPPGDMKIIDTTPPEMRFIYSGDRYGRAIVRWKFPRYEAGVDYEGELMTKHMNSTVYTKEKHAEVIDFRRRTPRRRALSAPERKQYNKQQKRRTK